MSNKYNVHIDSFRVVDGKPNHRVFDYGTVSRDASKDYVRNNGLLLSLSEGVVLARGEIYSNVDDSDVPLLFGEILDFSSDAFFEIANPSRGVRNALGVKGRRDGSVFDVNVGYFIDNYGHVEDGSEPLGRFRVSDSFLDLSDSTPGSYEKLIVPVDRSNNYLELTVVTREGEALFSALSGLSTGLWKKLAPEGKIWRHG